MKNYDSAMRRRVLLAAMTLAAIVTLVFGIDAFNEGLVGLGAVDLSICLISLGLLLVARRRPHSVVPSWAFVGVMSSFFVYLYASGGHGGTGLLFLLLLPLATPLFLGWRHGVAVSLTTLLICVGFLLRGTSSSPLPGVAEDATLARVGAIYVVSLVLSSLYDSGMQRAYRDETRAKEALRESEERHRTLFERTANPILVIDNEGNYMDGNEAALRFLECTREELTAKKARDFLAHVGEDELAELVREHKRLWAEGGRIDTEHYVNGKVKTLDLTITPGVWQGKTAVFGVGIDMTEQKRIEEQLKQSEERYRTILEETGDGYFESDLAGNFTFVNDAQARLLGYSRGELIGMNYRALVTKEKAKDLFDAYRHVYKTGEPVRSFLSEVNRKDGSIGHAETSAFPIRDDEGRIVGFRGVRRDITERKAAEEALELQRAYFQQLFDSSPDAIFLVDTEDRVVQVNRGCETLFGYSPEETGGRFPNELIVPEDRREEAASLSRAVLDGGVVREEAVRRRKDGSMVDVSIVGYPIRYEGGVMGAYVIYSDITERRLALEALNDQRAYFQQLFDSSPDAVVMLDTDDRVVRANGGFEGIFGYGEEETTGRPISDLVIPEGCEDEASSSSWEVLHGGVVRKEAVRKRKDGSLVDVAILGYPIDLDDRTVGMYVTYTDITQRKKMEKALEQAAEEWRKTFDSIGDPVSIHDEDYVLRRVNKAFAEAFGTEPSRIIGKRCYEVMHGTEAPIPGCPHKETLRTGTSAAAEFAETGLEACREVTTCPIFDDKGEIAGSVHIARDITERKRQEEHLMMADRLACVGELAAGTAHELNNPLTSVIGFSRLLLEKDFPDDVQEDLEIVCSEAQRAADVVKQLLKLAHRQLPVRNLNQVNDIISDVLRLRSYEQKVNNIEVKKKLARSLPGVMVDYFQMQQVLLNIIINAEHAIRESDNGGTVTVATQRRNNRVVVSVADDGPGIPGEHMSELFKPFFTTKRSGQGTGLGLSICHRIVTEHGGRIYARSRPGKGATFFVELPLNGA